MISPARGTCSPHPRGGKCSKHFFGLSWYWHWHWPKRDLDIHLARVSVHFPSAPSWACPWLLYPKTDRTKTSDLRLPPLTSSLLDISSAAAWDTAIRGTAANPFRAARCCACGHDPCPDCLGRIVVEGFARNAPTADGMRRTAALPRSLRRKG